MTRTILPPPFPFSALVGRTTPRTLEKALEIANTAPFEWHIKNLSKGRVRAVASIPTTQRSPFLVRVTWDGQSLQTRCTCPVRRGHYCSHRAALAILLLRYLRDASPGGGPKTAARQVKSQAESVPPPVVRGDRPAPILSLHAVEDHLVARLDFIYLQGAIRVSSAQASTNASAQIDGRTHTVERDRYRESQLEWRLIESGLARAPGGLFSGEGDSLAAFALEGIHGLRKEGWTLEGTDALDALDIRPQEVTFNVQVRHRIHWFSFAISANAGGHDIPVADVLQAWRDGKHYFRHSRAVIVRVPLDWLNNAGEMIEALRGFEKADEGAHRVVSCHIPLMATLLGYAEEQDVDPEFAAARERLEAISSPPSSPLPRGLRATLRPYQVGGYNWLGSLARAGVAGILADDMGLGKTLEVLTLLLADKEAGRGGQSLVVVPTSVLENWARETARFAPDLRTAIFHGPNRMATPQLENVDLLITSYALVRRDLEFHLNRSYYYVVLDEAQAIKNPTSDTAKACCRLQAQHRLALTGTPIENRLFELWSIFGFLMPELLGGATTFQQRYVVPIEKEGNAARQGELRQRVSPFILRRLKEDVTPELPPLTEGVLYCDLADDQAALYQSALKAFRRRIFSIVSMQGFDKSRFTVFEALLKLRLICCHPELSGLVPAGRKIGSAKLDLFLETLREIVDGGHRVLVFSQFVKMLQVLRCSLDKEGISYLYLDGRTRDRQARVDQFNSSDIPVFLISLKAGGTGLNLTGADYVVHYDPWWNPAVEAQATDRAHRIGQSKPVFAYRLITRGTVEEKILELHAHKQRLVDGLIAIDRAVGKQLTREDLELLFPEVRTDVPPLPLDEDIASPAEE